MDTNLVRVGRNKGEVNSGILGVGKRKDVSNVIIEVVNLIKFILILTWNFCYEHIYHIMMHQ